MKIHKLENRSANGYTTFGGCWKQGEVSSLSFALRDMQGNFVPVQSKALAYWPDGSIKWSAHTADAAKIGDCAELLPGSADSGGAFDGSGGAFDGSGSVSGGISIAQDAYAYRVDTGKLALTVPKVLPGASPDGAAFAGSTKASSDDTSSGGTESFSGCTDVSPVVNASLVENVSLCGTPLVRRIFPVFVLERHSEENGAFCTTAKEHGGRITSVVLEEAGPLQAVFCFHGCHVQGEDCAMPFLLRMYLWKDSAELKFVHTFLFDGKENRDYLKGMGIRFETVLTGKAYERHIQYLREDDVFHEAGQILDSRMPRLKPDDRRAQLDGTLSEALRSGQEKPETAKGAAVLSPMETIGLAARDLPVWNHYHLFQDSAFHYEITKRTKPGCCWLKACEKKRAPGVMAVTGTQGGVLLGIRDFWQKYPGGLAADGIGSESSSCTAWFYSPKACAFDFRHYDTRSYPYTCYEGFEEVGASAYGIGVTSECRLELTARLPKEPWLREFAARLSKPPVFVANPEYYHEKGAFGYWSLPAAPTCAADYSSAAAASGGTQTPASNGSCTATASGGIQVLTSSDSNTAAASGGTQASAPNGSERTPSAAAQLEAALDRAFTFYKNEVEARSWYGLFDYGDVMHTYDPVRHTWKYDVGGFAWQNTELVPTYWLWLYFLRTGREDVFTMAEAMSRHTSEVDVYHFGPLKGLGSRHNVRHWGCSCKEPRIAMAGHHRFLFYLTGDARIGDVMEDVLDADISMSSFRHSKLTLPDGSVVSGVRSGPDWSSYVSNWMTHYERTLDSVYKEKIETGTRDIAATPFGLASGPDYYYDTERAHLIYRGEIEDTPNQHLQICMGGPQVWLETADMLGDDTLKQLLVRLGQFYFLPPEEKAGLTDGKIRKRPFSWPMFAAGVSAYSAHITQDSALAKKTWEILLETVEQNAGKGGFYPASYVNGKPDGGAYQEIDGITTNWVSQWCLNVIMCLEFIPDALPEEGFEVLSKD